jgi:hypothetical protein
VRTVGVFLCLPAAAAAILLLTEPQSSGEAKTKSCERPAYSTVVVRSNRAVVFRRDLADVPSRTRRKLRKKYFSRDITLYGCSRSVGRRFRLWECNVGQFTHDVVQSIRLNGGRTAILEIERLTEENYESRNYYHVERRVSLRTGERRNIRSESRPQPEGTQPIVEGCPGA